MAMIEVRGLRKVYPDGTEAVKGVDFEVREGEFFGFLGPNGAGKSTTIKILVTLIAKTEGSATVAGFEVGREDKKIRAAIGYAAQDISIDEDLTGRENLVLSGQLYHMPKKAADERAEEVLQLVGLGEYGDKRAGNYSGGMRRRLDLAQALMHNPGLLFLDEPTTGLDPQNRRALWEELEKLNHNGVTIFLTTQYMDEADRLCGRLAVIDHGQIIAEGSPDSLKASLGGEVLTLSFPASDPDAVGAVLHAGAEVLQRVYGIGTVREAERTVIANLEGSARDVLPAALAALEDAKIEGRIAVSPPTLDDVFLHLTGHALREEEGKPTRRMPFSGRRRRRR
jgi:ABC-2 type transport system ATP-binding protein